MKIAYLGLGAWGFCLASLLAKKGYRLTCWSIDREQVKQLALTREHEMLPGHRSVGDMTFTTDLEEALAGAELIVESVTSKGVRPVFEAVKKIGLPGCPIAMTSKGIEQNTGLTLPAIVEELFGGGVSDRLAVVSGPSFAHDVIRGLPTSVVGSSKSYEVMREVCEIFSTDTFRVYPNSDILGVSYGGALKNIIAIACGISEGLALGYSCNAALITRGLHEIRKLSVAKGCRVETLYGLSGMGDLCLTCGSIMSRNYRFGHLLAEANSPEKAKEKIGMVVEGAYTAVSALQLSKECGVEMPITEAVNRIIAGEISPKEAVSLLMSRTIKEEHL